VLPIGSSQLPRALNNSRTLSNIIASRRLLVNLFAYASAALREQLALSKMQALLGSVRLPGVIVENHSSLLIHTGTFTSTFTMRVIPGVDLRVLLPVFADERIACPSIHVPSMTHDY
jgi:hypothetical protein